MNASQFLSLCIESAIQEAKKEFGEDLIDQYRGALMYVIRDAITGKKPVDKAVRSKIEFIKKRQRRMLTTAKTYSPRIGWERSGRRVSHKPISSDNLTD